ncbi:MAG: hypothetical protein MI867_16520, partial [Pseudomonadales bacterium]|nr:hypothetical protein [Pseudomonadales bacterium]
MRLKLGLVGFLLITLAACGGEGGGGGTLKSDVASNNSSGNTTNNNSGDSNSSSDDDVLATPSFSASQHVYLPLIEDLGWAYNIGSEQFSLTAQIYDESQDQFTLTSEVEVSSDEVSSLTEVLTSTSDAVNLVRIDAENMTVPVEGYQVTLNSLTFQNGQTLTLIGDSLSNGELPVTLNVDITYGFFSIRNSAINLPATATVTNEVTSIAIDGWGQMPALRVMADLRISGEVS